VSTAGHSVEDDFGGAVTDKGAVHVVDLRTGKEVLDSKLFDAQSLQGVKTIRLLADRQQFYVLCERPTDPVIEGHGGVQPGLMRGTGLAGVPVNGRVSVFSRKSGKLSWDVEMENQFLVLNHYREMPLLLFASRHVRLQNVAGQGMGIKRVIAAAAVEKRTGKMLRVEKQIPDAPYFHALHVSGPGDVVEFISPPLKLVFKSAASRPAPGK
jgi:hypothetical protein